MKPRNLSRQSFRYFAGLFFLSGGLTLMATEAIIRALAFKWIRILWKCWMDNLPYDEPRCLKHLASKNSPLVKAACAK